MTLLELIKNYGEPKALLDDWDKKETPKAIFDFEEIFEINHLGTPLLNGKKIFENPLIAFQKIIDKWKIKNNDLAAIGYISYDFKTRFSTTSKSGYNDKNIVSIKFPDHKIYKNNGKWISTKNDYDDDKIKNIIKAWENVVAVTVNKYQLNQNSIEEDCDYSKSCSPIISIETSSGEIIYFSIEKENPNLILGREQIGIQYTIMADDATQMF